MVADCSARHKLAPTVSPGKTWEGAVAGMLASLLLADGFALLVLSQFAFEVCFAVGGR